MALRDMLANLKRGNFAGKFARKTDRIERLDRSDAALAPAQTVPQPRNIQTEGAYRSEARDNYPARVHQSDPAAAC